MDSVSLLNTQGIIFLFVYLFSLLGIGVLGHFSKKENNLGDFYLANRRMSGFVLFLTLYATQYSGNTFFGFTGATYRIGYAWILSLHFMTSIVVCYLLFAPKLLKPSLFIKAWSSTSLNTLGFWFPYCSRGVTVPTSTNP